MTTTSQIYGFDVAGLKAVAEALSGGYEAAHSGHESTAGFAARFIRAVIDTQGSEPIRIGSITAGTITNITVHKGAITLDEITNEAADALEAAYGVTSKDKQC